MNKKRFIAQKDFNDNWNGYRSLEDGFYGTRVNGSVIGLHNWGILDYWGNLHYYIT